MSDISDGEVVSATQLIEELYGEDTVTECLTSDMFSMLLCGNIGWIVVFNMNLAPNEFNTKFIK